MLNYISISIGFIMSPMQVVMNVWLIVAVNFFEIVYGTTFFQSVIFGKVVV